MGKREKVGCYCQLYGNPTRNQVDVKFQPNWLTCPPKIAKEAMIMFLNIQGCKGASSLLKKPLPLRKIIAKSNSLVRLD